MSGPPLLIFQTTDIFSYSKNVLPGLWPDTFKHCHSYLLYYTHPSVSTYFLLDFPLFPVRTIPPCGGPGAALYRYCIMTALYIVETPPAYACAETVLSPELYSHQHQPAGRCSRTRRLPVLCLQDPLNLLRFNMSASYFHQRTGNNTHHIIEETAA